MQTRKRKRIFLSICAVFAAVCTALGVSAMGAKPVVAETQDEGVATAKTFADMWDVSAASVQSGVEITYDYLELKGKKGMQVSMEGSGASITYKNPVDVSKLTADDVFLQAAIMPTSEGIYDLGNFSVRLTDVNDPNNYVIIWASRHTGYRTETDSIFAAGTDEYNLKGILRGSLYEGLATTAISSTAISSSAFYARCVSGYRFIPPVGLRFDYANRRVFTENYATNGQCSLYTVWDFDETTLVGKGNEWGGFSTGMAYVSITAGDVANAPGRFIITNFMGEDYTAEAMVDTKAPVLSTDADATPEILDAVVGVKYPLFGATAYDFIDGEITEITKTLTLPDGTEQILTEEYFIPNAQGNYSLKYSATDGSGNVAEKTYEIPCRLIGEPLSLSLDGEIVASAFVGQSVKLPTASVEGGVGVLRYSVAVYRVRDGLEVEVENSAFVPKVVGEYEVVYTASDYLGSVKTERRYLEVSRSESPIIPTAPILPKSFLTGKLVKLPTVVAYDYISDKTNGKDAVVELYASTVEGQLGERIDYVFVPQITNGAASQDLYITYKIYCEGREDKAINLSYTVKVIEMKQLTDNFDKTNIAFEYAKTYIAFSPTADNASMQYMTPVSAGNFRMLYTVESDKNKFGALEVTLSDSNDQTKNVVIRMAKSYTEKLNVYVNEEKFEMYGSYFLGENAPIELRLSEDQTVLSDFQGTTICKLKTFSDGTPFTGFASGRVYVTIRFTGVTDAENSKIRLKQVGNQPISATLRKNGDVVDFVDRNEPSISLKYEIDDKGQLNRKVELPTAMAFDGVDAYTECFVNVTKDGGEIIELTDASTEGLNFVCSQYGTYLVTYSATDSAGNKITRVFDINVIDQEPPTITLKGKVKEVFSVGDTLYLPEAVVLDNKSDTTTFTFITDTKNKIVQVESGTYAFTEKGTYTLTYCAYDYDRNYTFLDFVLVVE